MADIRFEFNGALAETIGKEGLADAQWEALSEEAAGIADRIAGRLDARPYRLLPEKKDLSQVDAVKALAEEWQGRFDDVVVLGIGGSALGTIALRTALLPPYWNLLTTEQRGGRPRLWVMDNVDPDEFQAMLDAVNLERTLFNVISKSGGTAETISQFLVAHDKIVDELGADALPEHLVITTGAEGGLLRPIVKPLGVRSFVVPEGVGGRFSVLSPVGLFPAAMVGIDVDKLLAGAKAMDEACRSGDFDTNLAAQGAAVQIGLYREDKPISVMMPYSAALRDVADWYRQLWAESLGKRRKQPDGTEEYVGPTPVKALGVTDQHSQVQLYREGPADKVFTILSVDRRAEELSLPEGPESLEGFDYLADKTMADLLNQEQRATVWALAKASGRPTVRIALDAVTPETVGRLLQMLMVQTSIAGEMLGINTYNQPGVEAGKEATRALMGKTGPLGNPGDKGLPEDVATYEDLRDRIETFLGKLAGSSGT
jgi:glucose-6-phosphate isomerase